MSSTAPAANRKSWFVVERSSRADVIYFAELLGALGLCAGFAYALLNSGGRDPHATVVALVLALPALVASRAWQRVSSTELLLAAAIAGAAATVPMVTPLGMTDGRAITSYLYAPVAYLAVRAFGFDAGRRRILMLGFLLSAVLELSKIWPVWIGSDDTSTQLVGTFYWHNQFGIYAAAVAAAGTVLAVRSGQRERWFAWVLAPAAVAATVLSRSRGSELALALAVAVLAVALGSRRDFRGLVKLAAVLVVAVGLIQLMFIAVGGLHGSPSLASVPSASDESFGGNAAHRWHFWGAAIRMFGDSPITGHGFGSFGVLAGNYLPTDAGWSRWVHSGPLQAMTDGGLLLGLPVLIATGLGIWAVSRRLLMTARPSAAPFDPVRWAASLGALVLLAHTWIDFDWQYPTLSAAVAILLGLVVTHSDQDADVAVDGVHTPESSPQQAPSVWHSVLPLLLLAPALALGVALNQSYWAADRTLKTAMNEATRGDNAAAVALMARDLRRGHLRDPRAAVWLVSAAKGGTPVPSKVIREALTRSRDYASVDADFAPIWRAVRSNVAPG